MHVECHFCGSQFQVVQDMAGKEISCGKCGEKIHVRGDARTKEKDKAKKYICRNCGFLTDGERVPTGSSETEKWLWILFIVFFVLIWIPIIYHITRHTVKKLACSNCRSSDLVPTNSPAGQKLIRDYHS